MNSRIDWMENTRIIWAITAKDIIDALKNKNTITVIITSLLMVVFYRYMPTLFYGDEPLNVLVFDAGEEAGNPSALVAFLENDNNLDAYTGYTSAAQMQEILTHGDLAELGLVIPEGFDRALERGDVLPLQGYVMYWVDQEEVIEIKAYMEGEITRLIGRPVPIQLDGNVVYPTPDSGGVMVQAGIAVVFVLTMVGISMVGHLMLEEKQGRTLEALLVSPATAGQVVVGKALTGIFYCLLGSGVALVLNWDLTLHGWLAILAVLCGSAFTVSLGLWIGTMIEDRGQLTLWAWIILVPLLIPLFLSLLAELLPTALVQVVEFVPTVVLFNVVRASMADPIQVGSVLLQLAYVAAWAGGVLFGVAWLVRRQDRVAEERSWLQLAHATQGAPQGIETTVDTFPATSLHPAMPHRKEDAADPLRSPAQVVDFDLSQQKSPNGLRLIGAIAAKDVWDAIRNKLIISIILGVAIMIASNALIPLLFNRGDIPSIVVYDEGRSTIIRGLTGRDEFRLGVVDSREAFNAAISESQLPRLGVVIPAEFDQQAAGERVISLEGYTAHYADLENIQRWTTFFEEQLGLATWGVVQIQLDGHELYPSPEAGGQILLVSILIVVVIATMGITLVPLLIVDEKENHTLDALLASPVGFLHVIAGKALVGVFYCLASALVLFFFYQHLFVSMGIALLATLTTIAFAVAVGMLVGMVSDSPTTTGMWGALLLVTFLGTAILAFVNQAGWPLWLQSVSHWLPGLLMVNLYRFSMAGGVPISAWLAPASILLVEAGFVYLLVAWILRRQDR